MIKLYAFAVVALFWITLSASLLHLEITASPIHKMRGPNYRFASRGTAIAAAADHFRAVTYYR